MYDFNRLTKATPECVHFIAGENFFADSFGPEFALMKGSLVNVHDEKSLFAVLSRAMQFPDYFGHNWDAFDECARDLQSWLPAAGYVLVLQGSIMAWSQNSCELGNLIGSWMFCNKSWLAEGTPFHLVFLL